MAIDFNDEIQLHRHHQIIAICLANTLGDMINSSRTEWHWSTHMDPPASEDEVQAAVLGYMLISEWIKAYREFYGEGATQ